MSLVKKARMNKKPKPTPIVQHCEDLSFVTDCHLKPLYTNKEKGFKLVKVQTSLDNPNPLRVQFSSIPGRIPQKFGVDTNQHGKTYLTFAIPCDKEYDAVLKFQEDAKDYAKSHKEEWWNYPITDGQIEDNFAGLVSARKPKKEGDGFWPGNMKVHIPLDKNGDCDSKCSVLNEEGNPISIHELPGRKWDSVMIEIGGVYFQNRFNWGFGPKTLRLVQLADDDSSGYVPTDVDYCDILLDKKKKNSSPDEASTPVDDQVGMKRHRDDDDPL
jgi:hypothetical protein